MANQSGYLTWNICTEEQKAIIIERLGLVITQEIAKRKDGDAPLFEAIRFAGFHALYQEYTRFGYQNGPMTIELVNAIILKLFDDIDFGNIESQLKD